MLSQKVIIYFFPTIQIFVLTYFQCVFNKCVSDNHVLNIKHLIGFKELVMQR